MMGKGFLLAVGLSVLLALVLPQSTAVVAPPCPTNVSLCTLPTCLCSSQSIPGGLTRLTTPQIVYLTFDDAISVINYPFYVEMFANRKNPNNASISVTFFVTHEYTDYSLVHQLWRAGHDIALHSITHQTNTVYWQSLNESEWRAEFVDQRDQMSTLAAIPKADIQGMRAPFLQTGGNDMYKALSEGAFTWECSRPTWNQRQPGIWPYTNDYASTQDCQISPCATDQFKGFWTVPMIDLIGGDKFPCAMVDQCNPVPKLANETLDFLKSNFLDQYNGNRAPFGIYTHSALLVGPVTDPQFAERKLGYSQFLDYLATLKDVYIVGISKGLEWVKKPTPVAQLANFTAWKDPAVVPTDLCEFPRSCRYVIDSQGSERYMNSCVACPPQWPWLHNPLGQ
jgi:hypothetical protein